MNIFFKSRDWETKSFDQKKKIFEHAIENLIFKSRWILVIGYLCLIGVLLLLSLAAIGEFFQLLYNFRFTHDIYTTSESLIVIDVILVMNLVVVVLFVGYKWFVSRFDAIENHEDIPVWLKDFDYSGLKLQLIGSIIAISSIKLLQEFIFISGVKSGAADKIYKLLPEDVEKFKLLLMFQSVFVLTFIGAAFVGWLKKKTH